VACTSCGRGFHWECGDPCCCSQDVKVIDEVEEDDESPRGRRSTTYKRDSNLKDQQSTGRKRAAVLYPLDETAPCEWQGLKFAGGSRFPIVGCASGTQQARHHGPDKNTLNNEEGNVHRICHRCHNRWHTKNDIGYVWGDPGKSHDSVTKATLEELAENEFYWARNKTVKAKD
jgi:hypothetical protein